jgi:hypothetical protein
MVIPHYDYKVICGGRDEAAQNLAHAGGYSTVTWPHSRHNHRILHVDGSEELISQAVDMAPWFPELPHIRWDHEREFIYLAGYMKMAAAALGVKIRWGGDWDQDKDLYDVNKPFDLGHFELVG